MERITSQNGTVISYDRYGDGPPLVLVHGGFSDHNTNWAYVKAPLGKQFEVYALARRGRGETDATEGHRLEAEAADVAAVIQAAGEPVFLLGHSYGALCALEAAALVPDRIAKLVLYEPPWPSLASPDVVARLEQLGQREDWNTLVETFLTDVLLVPWDDVKALQGTPDWAPWIADARATLGDMRALVKYTFTPEPFRTLTMPVLLLVGSESPRELYVTDALAATLPDVRVVPLEGQAHEGMTTAPELFVETVARFLVNQQVGGKRPVSAP
ncbi:MAG: alpha/beta fold hydrolase [Dehalococcoidia bacterium]